MHEGLCRRLLSEVRVVVLRWCQCNGADGSMEIAYR